jgi:FixJ family two-component response regulator
MHLYRKGADMNLTQTHLETPIVFVVDGDASMRDALACFVGAAGWQSRTVASAEEFLALPRVTTPSCLLVELQLPGMSGLDLQRLIADRSDMPVIFMSSRADVRATVQAMKGGAFEFLTKPFADDLLPTTLRHALERSQAALRRLSQIKALEDRYESLSRREREVMGLVVCGRLNKQVGCELGISEITVKAHRAKMMRKMQAASFAELVKMAASLGQAPPRNVSVIADRAPIRPAGSARIEHAVLG